MHLLAFCQWIEKTPVGAVIRDSSWLFDTIESAHTLGIVLVAGTIFLLDLRLLGFGLREEPVRDVVERTVPWTLAGFFVMALTGAWLFAGEASKLYRSPAFRIKLILLALVGLNALLFHVTVYRRVAEWIGVPVRARVAGVISLVLWVCIIAAGRSIAYGPGYDQ
ncbi:MAG TPA: DUF6644 family protein [Bryobacteraceae bacterium]|nr:DUF6644 family protein [Bryobacteraceae bacterium]